jgi:hypothetical protein
MSLMGGMKILRRRKMQTMLFDEDEKGNLIFISVGEQK